MKGYSPWPPDAVYSTIKLEIYFFLILFNFYDIIKIIFYLKKIIKSKRFNIFFYSIEIKIISIYNKIP